MMSSIVSARPVGINEGERIKVAIVSEMEEGEAT